MRIETAMVFDNQGRRMQWHQPEGRTEGYIPDDNALWEYLWANREILGGVAHTHPWVGEARPSRTDTTTFRAIERGLGRLLLWPIVTFSEVRCFVWNQVTHEYCEAAPLAFELEGIDELRTLSGFTGEL